MVHFTIQVCGNCEACADLQTSFLSRLHLLGMGIIQRGIENRESGRGIGRISEDTATLPPATASSGSGAPAPADSAVVSLFNVDQQAQEQEKAKPGKPHIGSIASTPPDSSYAAQHSRAQLAENNTTRSLTDSTQPTNLFSLLPFFPLSLSLSPNHFTSLPTNHPIPFIHFSCSHRTLTTSS